MFRSEDERLCAWIYVETDVLRPGVVLVAAERALATDVALLLYAAVCGQAEALLLSSAPLARAGGTWAIHACGYAFYMPLAVGLIAVAGVTAKFGVVTLLYIRDAVVRGVAHGEDADAVLVAALREGALLFARRRRDVRAASRA